MKSGPPPKTTVLRGSPKRVRPAADFATPRWSEYCLPLPSLRQTFPLDAMKAVALKGACRSSIAVVILFCAIGGVLAQPRQSPKLNQSAFAFAEELIKKGHVIADGRGAWSEHRPSAEDENAFIRVNGFSEYAKWHLGIDERYPENTKRRYKFPYGDFKNVHRCGLLAARTRAAEHRYYDIEDAAARLIEIIASKKERSVASLPNP
jgi:hypothetical protein